MEGCCPAVLLMKISHKLVVYFNPFWWWGGSSFPICCWWCFMTVLHHTIHCCFVWFLQNKGTTMISLIFSIHTYKLSNGFRIGGRPSFVLTTGAIMTGCLLELNYTSTIGSTYSPFGKPIFQRIICFWLQYQRPQSMISPPAYQHCRKLLGQVWLPGLSNSPIV